MCAGLAGQFHAATGWSLSLRIKSSVGLVIPIRCSGYWTPLSAQVPSSLGWWAVLGLRWVKNPGRQ